MSLTLEAFKKYINQIRYASPDLKQSVVELLSEIINDDMGYINHYVFTLDFGFAPFHQLTFGRDGEAIDINSIDALWNLLNYHSEEKKVNIREVTQDLFAVPQGYYLAHCISGDYALGAGIAVTFDKNYNMRFKLHRDYAIPEGEKFANVGRALLVDNVFNLVTKERSFYKPTYDTLYETLVDMRNQCEKMNIEKLAMPLIGCGLDRLQWDKVRDIIEDVFENTDIEILVCSL